MAYSASHIAAILVMRGIEERNYLSQMKLQKVVFFAHGYHLARYDEPLIVENFQAWKFGPVLQSIYHDFKLYGSNPITDTNSLSDPYYRSDFNPKKLSKSAQDAINYTWEVTKGLTAAQLSNWTHLKGSPWSESYNERDKEIIIRNDLIKNYFQSKILEHAQGES